MHARKPPRTPRAIVARELPAPGKAQHREARNSEFCRKRHRKTRPAMERNHHGSAPFCDVNQSSSCSFYWQTRPVTLRNEENRHERRIRTLLGSSAPSAHSRWPRTSRHCPNPPRSRVHRQAPARRTWPMPGTIAAPVAPEPTLTAAVAADPSLLPIRRTWPAPIPSWRSSCQPPDVARNPEFYLFGKLDPSERRPTRRSSAWFGRTSQRRRTSAPRRPTWWTS